MVEKKRAQGRERGANLSYLVLMGSVLSIILLIGACSGDTAIESRQIILTVNDFPHEMALLGQEPIGGFDLWTSALETRTETPILPKPSFS